MSKWDDIKSGFEALAGKTADKTKELTTVASIKIKIANKEADRDREYKILGKLTYAKLKNLNVCTPEELTERISGSLAKIDATLAEINALKRREKELKEAKEAEKAARAEAKRAKEEAEYESEDDEFDTVIMDEFNEARKTADVEYEKANSEYEKAKQSAEDAEKAE